MSLAVSSFGTLTAVVVSFIPTLVLDPKIAAMANLLDSCDFPRFLAFIK